MLASLLTARHWRPCFSSCESDLSDVIDYPDSRQGSCQRGIGTGARLEFQPPHGNRYSDTSNSDAVLGHGYMPPAAPTFGSPVSTQTPQHLLVQQPTRRDHLGDVLSPPAPRLAPLCQSPPQDGARSLAAALDTAPEPSPAPPRPPAQHRSSRPRYPDGEMTAAPRPTASDPPCEVCGESASGHYFGALVCLPCKSFFIRCTKSGEPTFSSQCGGNCDVLKLGRIRCQFCRFQRCLSAGMYRKEKPEAVVPAEGQMLCKVCCDIANGVHFGVTTCEGCKKFFRRGLKEHHSYVCKASRKCTINPRMRNNCRYCRFQKCLNMGMSRDAIKMGRPKKDGNAVCRQDELQNNLEEKQAPFKSTVETFPLSYPDLKPVALPSDQGSVSSDVMSAHQDPSGDGGDGSQDESRPDHELCIESYESSSFSDDFLAAVSMDMRASPGPLIKMSPSDSDIKTLLTSSAQRVSHAAAAAALRHVTANVGGGSVDDDSNTSGSCRLMSEDASPVHISDFFQTRVRWPLHPPCRAFDARFSSSSSYTASESQRLCLSPELEGSFYRDKEQDRKLQPSFLPRPTSHLTGPTDLNGLARHHYKSSDHVVQPTLSNTYPDPGYSCSGDVTLTPQVAASSSVSRTLIQSLSVCVQMDSLPRDQLGSQRLPGLVCAYNQPHRYDPQQCRDYGQGVPEHRPTCTLDYDQCSSTKSFRSTSVPGRGTNEAGLTSFWPGADRDKRDALPSTSPCDLHDLLDTFAERPGTVSGVAAASGKQVASPCATDVPEPKQSYHDADSQDAEDCFIGNACSNPIMSPGPDLAGVHRPLSHADTVNWLPCPASRRRPDATLNYPARKRRRWADRGQDHKGVSKANGEVKDVPQFGVNPMDDDTQDPVFLSKLASRPAHRNAFTFGCSVGQTHGSRDDRSKLNGILALDSELACDERSFQRKNKPSGLAWTSHQEAAPASVAESTVRNEDLLIGDADSLLQDRAPEGCCAMAACDQQQDSQREFLSPSPDNGGVQGRECRSRSRRKVLEKNANNAEDWNDGISTCKAENSGTIVSTATSLRSDRGVNDDRTSGSSLSGGDVNICGNDGIADENCEVRLRSAGELPTSSSLDIPSLSITVDTGALLEVDRGFLAVDNSCKMSDCQCNEVGSLLGFQGSQRDFFQAPACPRERGIFSSTCPVTHSSSCTPHDLHLPSRTRRRQSWYAFSPSHAREHWHQHTWASGSLMNTDSAQTIQAAVRALNRLREVLSDPDLNKVADQMEADQSVEPLVQMYRLKVIMTTASGHFLAQLPGCQEIASEDKRLLSQEGGFGPAFLLTAFLAYDADVTALQQLWNWIVPAQSPLFAFKVHLLRVADHIQELGPDVTEVALLCALCLLGTDIEGIHDRVIIHKVREAVMGALEAHHAANGQLPSSRLMKLLGVMPGVNFVTAWFNSLVQTIART